MPIARTFQRIAVTALGLLWGSSECIALWRARSRRRPGVHVALK